MTTTLEKTNTKRVTKNKSALERKQLLEDQRRIQPKHCLKYIRCVIDQDLSEINGTPIENILVNLDIKFIFRSGQPGIIYWERLQKPRILSTTDNMELTEKYVMEKHIILFFESEKFLESAITKKEFNVIIENIKKKYPAVSITILIYGLKQFMKVNSMYRRSTIDFCLTEIQFLHKCSHRLIESAVELGTVIAQFTKAIAEQPFKQQQVEKSADLNLFLTNDNKDCVRIEGLAGMYRLWQQHLTRLPLITLETAEAVISMYQHPKKLFSTFECNLDEGAATLSDIKVRRGGGPLQTSRRIGPELSRKIYTLYTSVDPEEVL